jgi:hypothetical protein
MGQIGDIVGTVHTGWRKELCMKAGPQTDMQQFCCLFVHAFRQLPFAIKSIRVVKVLKVILKPWYLKTI